MLFFPQLGAAIVVRRNCPKNARLVTTVGGNGVYLIETSRRPRGCQIAEGPLGGWNFESGVCITLVYGARLSDMSRYCIAEAGDWLIFPRELPNGRLCGLLKIPTTIDFSIGCTPVVL